MDKIPPDRMMDMANTYAERHIQGTKCFGGMLRQRTEIIRDFCEGFEAGVRFRGSGELLAENHQLQEMYIDLSIGQRRIIALESLVTRIAIATCDHEDRCQCTACQVFVDFRKEPPDDKAEGKA